MNLLVIPLIILVSLIYGGWRFIQEIKPIKVMSIHGALFAFVVLSRYLVYACGVVIVILLYTVIFVPESNRSLSFGHKFNLELDEDSYTIVRTDTNEADITLQSVTGTVDMADASGPFLIMIAVLGTLFLVLLHQLLCHAEPVLLSLYRRVPFTRNNADHTRRASMLILVLWFLYYAYMVGMTLFFIPRLETTGLEISMVELPFLSALFTAGIVFVLSEVFRVGFELKEEQEFTV
ncbi:MAG: DUF2975 domain-containing protein [Gammaproteobacteria bacterium]